MSKFEAVDRMMAMAIAKRSDPEPPHVPGATSTPGALAEAEPETKEDTKPGSKARAMFDAARPLLPVVAGVLRGAESGGLGAVGRLLPLLTHFLSNQPNPARPAATPAPGPAPAPSRTFELEAAHRDLARRFDALQLKQEGSEDELRRLRTQLERLTSEHTGTVGELRKLSERFRLVAAGAVILLMLLLAQLVVTVIVMHR